MSLTKLSSTLVANSAITSEKIANNAITTEKISNNVTLGGPKIANVQYADASFTVLDDTAANTAGTARLIINGEGFNSGAIVIVGTTQASSTTLVNSAQLRANVTAQAAGSYPIYVQNSDGGTAIRVGGVTFSNTPIWGTAATLSNQAANTAFAVSVSANSDSNVTYSNTTSLPAGTSLLSNGYFYGTVTIGSETTYTFDVKANDAENQDVSRTFSLTVTVTPLYSLYAAGRNSYGSFGLNDNDTYRSSPVQVGSGSYWLQIAGGYGNTLALRNDNTLWAWGYNASGELGVNDSIFRSSPVQIGTGTNWTFVAGSNHLKAFKTDGTMWAWGISQFGYHGDGTTINKSSPVQISGTNWNGEKFDYSAQACAAIKTDGTLWTWGRGDNGGGLGLNDNIQTNASPRQVGSGTDWSFVSVSGFFHGAAIKTNGTLWLWGQNSYGQLGLNESGNYVNKSSPVQVGSSTNWSKVKVGHKTTLAIKTDGTLWAWGVGSDGGLGLNSLNHRSSPTQVGTETTWDDISPMYSNYDSVLATKTDKTLWAWGSNQKGQLGLNDVITKSSPTQVTGSTWKLASRKGMFNRNFFLKS